MMMKISYSFRMALFGFAFTFLTGCGEVSSRTASMDQLANDMIAWSRANPEATETSFASHKVWKCTPVSSQICAKEGCSSGKTAVWAEWEPKTNIYRRCDKSGCSEYVSSISFSGSWVNVASEGRGMTAKIATGGDFLEIVTQNSVAYVYHGKCVGVR
jgi:hypothetical protein